MLAEFVEHHIIGVRNLIFKSEPSQLRIDYTILGGRDWLIWRINELNGQTQRHEPVKTTRWKRKIGK